MTVTPPRIPGGTPPPPAGLAAYPSLAANPVLSSWLAFSPDGTVTICSGKVEYGQGVWTALAQVAAEELDVALARVTVAPVSTGRQPGRGGHLGQPVHPAFRLGAAPGLRAGPRAAAGRGRRRSSAPPR